MMFIGISKQLSVKAAWMVWHIFSTDVILAILAGIFVQN